MRTQTKTQNHTKTKLWIDIAIFIAFLISMDPHTSGIAVHEWLATGAFAVLVAHLLVNWDWIVGVTWRFLSTAGARSRLNYILNWLLFIDGTVIMLSGWMISEALLPALGIRLTGNFAWRSWHDLSANLFLVLLGLHTALHWSWIVESCKRCLFQPVARIISSHRGRDLSA